MLTWAYYHCIIGLFSVAKHVKEQTSLSSSFGTLKQAHRPFLVVVEGLDGTGKHIADALSRLHASEVIFDISFFLGFIYR